MRKSICAIALLICPLGPVASIADDEVKIYRPEDIQWTQAPALKRGGMWSVLIGNRDKKGDVVVQRIRMPPNFVICPHTHPYNETITVISGVLGLGMGTSFERGENLFSPGTLISQKAKHPHFAWTGSEGAVFQVQFNAPGGLDYVNDRDDPRKFPQGDEPSGCARGQRSTTAKAPVQWIAAVIVVGCNVGSSGGLEANLPLSLCKLAQYGGYLIRRARLRGVRRKRDCAEVQVGLSTRLGSYVGPSLLATL